MLKPLVEFSIRYRGVVIALACVATVYGISTAARAKIDATAGTFTGFQHSALKPDPPHVIGRD